MYRLFRTGLMFVLLFSTTITQVSAKSYQEALADSCFAPRPGPVVSIADLPGGDESQRPVIYPQLGQPVHALAVSPDGHYVVSGGHDGDLKLWEIETGRLVWTVETYRGLVMFVVFSPDGRRIYSLTAGGNKGIGIHDPRTGKEKGRISIKTSGGYGNNFFTHHGTHFFYTTDWRYSKSGLFELPSGSMVHEFKGKAKAISPNGRYAVTIVEDGGKEYLYLWDACKNRLIKSTRLEKGFISESAFSPDGHYLAVHFREDTGEGKYLNFLVMYDAPSGRKIWQSPKFKDPMYASLCFSGDSKHLLYSGIYPPLSREPDDWDMYVFNPQTGRVVHKYEIPSSVQSRG